MRRRVLGAIVAASVAAVLAFGLPLAVLVAQLYRDEEVIRLERVAAEAGVQIGSRIDGADAIELPRQPAGIRVALYAPTGTRVDGDGPRRADGTVLDGLAGSVSDRTGHGELVVAVPVSRDERVIGAIRVARDEQVVVDRVRRARLLLLALGAAAVGLAAAVGVWLSRRLARPVELLAAEAERLGDGDFAIASTRSGIGEVDAAGVALAQTARRLADVLERERAFSSDASHQLRTPLAALRLDLEAAALARPAPAAADVAAKSLLQVERLEETIETLLALARDAPADPDDGLALSALVGELEEEWRGPLAASGRPLRVELDTTVADREVPARAAREIVRVLLANAHAHGRGAVTVAARAAGPAVALDVRDEGSVSGAPARLFARRDPGAAGTGIGLSLARSLAEAAGGRLAYDGSTGSTTFTLLLPSDGVDSSR